MKNVALMAIPALAAFVTSVIAGKIIVPALAKAKMRQYEREEGPESHKKKQGTPTMGGVIFLLATLIVSLFYIGKYPEMIPVMIGMFGFGFIGLIDDSMKMLKKQNEGMTPSQKMLGQIVVAVAVVLYLQLVMKTGTEIHIPFVNGTYNVGIFYYVIVAIMILGTVNGSNLTDGLDGLSANVTFYIAIFFSVASLLYKAGITPIAAALAGALLGFLMFNTHPAKVFMGDTGSLALGGFVASSALVIKNPLIIIIVAFVYLMETLSVMIQVASFKTTGKRVFRMSPIHHHFELGGWPETEVTSKFAIISALACLLGLLAL